MEEFQVTETKRKFFKKFDVIVTVDTETDFTCWGNSESEVQGVLKECSLDELGIDLGDCNVDIQVRERPKLDPEEIEALVTDADGLQDACNGVFEVDGEDVKPTDDPTEDSDFEEKIDYAARERAGQLAFPGLSALGHVTP
jgi:hypothetical protein